MDEEQQGPCRDFIGSTSTCALLSLQSHEPLDDWYFGANRELEVLVRAVDGNEDGSNEFDEFAEFDEGDGLEPDLAPALSSVDREAADKNCLEFDEHVAQVGSSGLIVGPFRTPIEPCVHLCNVQLQLHFRCSSCYG